MRTLLLLSLLSAPVLAQDLLVMKHSPARVVKVDSNTGTILNPVFVDIDSLLGLGGANRNHWDAALPGNGELWISTFSDQAIQRFAADGSAYLGDFATPPGSAVGMALFSGSLWAATTGGAFGAGIVEYDVATTNQVGSVTVGSVWDVYDYGGQLLASQSSGSIVVIDATTGTVGATFSSPGGFMEQMTTLANGNLLVGVFSPAGLHEIDPAGGLVQTIGLGGVGSVRGCAQLGNGDYLVNGTGGTFIVDAATGGTTLIDAGSGAFIISEGGGSGFGSNYCMGVPNSTGLPATLTAFGSPFVAQNNVTLRASDLPPNQFGYFLNSVTQGFIPNPGGSQGNLCLSGAIGRYNPASGYPVQNSGTAGEITLMIDLTQTPTPGGAVAITAGSTWNFQCWYRDLNPSSTSNFTEGLEVGFQ